MLYYIAILWITAYAAVAAFSVYIALVGKEKVNNDAWLGKLIIWHGRAVLIVLVASVAFAGAMILTQLVLAGLHINIVTS